MAGKGDGRRPAAVKEKELEDAWARTFGGLRGPGKRILERKVEEALEEAFKAARVIAVDFGFGAHATIRATSPDSPHLGSDSPHLGNPRCAVCTLREQPPQLEPLMPFDPRQETRAEFERRRGARYELTLAGKRALRESEERRARTLPERINEGEPADD